ncbi:MAG: hypothetical protein GY809_11220 [Planctomycetes bacterium]|nr:hypothetical protein [Planctomycetota bacterium]
MNSRRQRDGQSAEEFRPALLDYWVNVPPAKATSTRQMPNGRVGHDFWQYVRCTPKTNAEWHMRRVPIRRYCFGIT